MNLRYPRILLCALDWGLGHASRCIPLARLLQAQGARVWLGSAGPASELLRTECPDFPQVVLPAYGVRYATSNMYWNMATQLPRIGRAIVAEQRWLQGWVTQNPVDAIISDHRYGIYHPHITSIFLAHQLHLKLSPPGLSSMVNAAHGRWLKRYAEIWVPDYPPPHGLAGNLVDLPLPAPRRHLGWLSRFPASQATTPRSGPLVVLLSGPEPQRTYLERLIWPQLTTLGEPVVLIQGRPGARPPGQHPAVQVHNWLWGDALHHTLAQARAVVCRSGYSTLMDLAVLGQRAALIPTPGQTEQIYLAQHAERQGWAPWQPQGRLDLAELLARLPNYTGLPHPPAAAGLALTNWQHPTQ